MKLPACDCRLPLPGETSSFFCAHPQMHAPDSIVSASICKMCSLWRTPPANPRPYRQRGPRDGMDHIDTVIGCWATRANLPLYVFRPSLVQHIGDTSTIWTQATNTGIRRADHFLGPDTDANALFPPNAS